MARPGRPRKPGRRTRSGRLAQARDHGTEQLQAMRARLAQGGNPDLTAYPLGVLLANGAITEQQHEAGCRYAWLHAAVFGRASCGAMAWERRSRSHDGDWNDEWLKRQNQRLKGATRKFGQHPARLKMVLESVAVYERTPRWMLPLVPRVSDIREAELLVMALRILAQHFQRRFDKAA